MAPLPLILLGLLQLAPAQGARAAELGAAQNDPRVAGALVTIAGGALLWFATRAYELWRRAQDRRAQREALIHALFAEIDYNTIDLEDFVRISRPTLETLRTRFQQDPALVPHVTDARHTVIYRERIKEIHDIGERNIAQVVAFYGELEKIKNRIDAIQQASFLTISPEGRFQAIQRIYDRAEDAAERGRRLLEALARDHAHLDLTPSPRFAAS